jgi:hypothetical protein
MAIGLDPFLQMAFRFVHNSASSAGFVCCIGFDMLALVPQIVEDLDISRKHRVALMVLVQQFHGRILQVGQVAVLSCCPD